MIPQLFWNIFVNIQNVYKRAYLKSGIVRLYNFIVLVIRRSQKKCVRGKFCTEEKLNFNLPQLNLSFSLFTFFLEPYLIDRRFLLNFIIK
jgi:hypothetical protein